MLYTIGYAGKSIEDFLICLQKYKINYIIDVRSIPYSKYYTMYNKENIEVVLKQNNINYLSLGEEFGAKRENDLDVYKPLIDYQGNKIQVLSYTHVYKRESFKRGVKTIFSLLEDHSNNICFMCSEKDPFNCHRSVMIAHYFYKKKIECLHIIDIEKSIAHNNLLSNLEKEYDNAHKKFVQAELRHKIDPYNLIWWNNFFSKYDMQKGIFIRNIQINSKKY